MKVSGRVYTDGSGNATSARIAPGSLERLRVTGDTVQDPEELARILTTLVKVLEASTYQSRGEVYVEFEDVAVSTAGAEVTLRHALGKRPRWSIVRWSSSGSSAPVLKESLNSDGSPKSDTNQLVLASYVAGTATVRVF